MTLTDFLLSRIAEDEKRANDALAAEPKYLHFGDTAADALLGLAESEGADTFALLHFGRHRPGRVLAECKAKRQQIAHLIRFMEGDYAPWNEEQLQIMATVYADHTDYREEWKP